MIDINTYLNFKSLQPKWRFTKYWTGAETNPQEKMRNLDLESKDEMECLNRPTDVESITKYCIEWSQRRIGVDFKFRQFQLEYIVTVLDNILNKNVKINCLEAPTGSGKSWIAFIIAGVAWEYYRKTSYILVSDLGLMNQYWNDVCKYNFNEIGRMKGLGNYMCEMNGMAFTSGECRIKKMSYSILLKKELAQRKGYNCTEDCQCLLDRKRAIVSPITIMTYVLYLCHMNDVLPIYESSDELPPFDKRDIVICDEVHKMPGIVQSWCSPEFDLKSDVPNFERMIDFINDNRLFNDTKEEDFCTIKNMKKFHKEIVLRPDKKDAIDAFMEYFKLQNLIVSNIDKIRHLIIERQQKSGDVEKEDKQILFLCSWFENRHSHFDKYPKIIEKIGYEKLVVNAPYDSQKKCYDTEKFTINCVYEEYLIKEFFNDKSDSELMMSATIGDCGLFRREIGVEIWNQDEIKDNFRFMRIPSTFDFSKSPIYVLPNYKMSFALKDQNMPYIIKLVDQILAAHPNQKGIVHTGSYDFSRRLYEGVNLYSKNRILNYTSARNKDFALDEFAFSDGKVLIGPTLIEGINLPDDACRFMIIMKIPYPNLGDKLVEAKKDAIPNWYNGETVKSVIQSLGRGIRHKNDWCVTYIIDGSFCTIYNATQHNLSDDLKKRIQYVTV